MNAASIKQLEMYVNRRLIAVCEVLSDKYGIPIPITLQITEGDRLTRSLVRLGSVAEFLEFLVFEDIQKGLGDKLKVYDMNTVEAIRSATVEDLMVVDGVGEKTASEIKKLVEHRDTKALTEAAAVEVLGEDDDLRAELPDDWLKDLTDDGETAPD